MSKQLEEAKRQAYERGQNMGSSNAQYAHDSGDIADIVTGYTDQAFPLEEMPDQETDMEGFSAWYRQQNEDRQKVWGAYAKGVRGE